MHFLILLLQDIDIDQKLKDAPDSGYGIGVFIGTILPFVILVAVAYAIYRHKKKNFKNN